MSEGAVWSPGAGLRPGGVGSEAPRPSVTGTPSIAVVIPLYNGSRHIEATVLSALRQTLPPTEIIVVDDGSTDEGRGADIVRRLARGQPIRLLTRQNGGQSAARNWGVSQTACDLIAFLDHDDVWYPNHLAQLAEPFATTVYPPLGWVYSDLDEVDENGMMVCRSFLRTMATPHPKRSIFDCIGQDMFILPSASLIRRTAFLQVGGFDETLCGYEDDDLFLRLFRAGHGHAFLEQSLSQWRISVHSTSYSPRMKQSRRVYIAKLIATFPDDVWRSRYYIRDLIVPRFLGPAIDEHLQALEAGDVPSAEQAWAEVRMLARGDGALQPKLLESTLARHCHAAIRGETEAGSAWADLEDMCRQNDGYEPLLLELALKDYKRALIEGNRVRIAGSRTQLARVAQRGSAVRLRVVLGLLRWIRMSQGLFAVRQVARPLMVWAFRGRRRLPYE